MIAEIKGKVKCEDELTGSFFGNLRYIPFDKGLKKNIVECHSPDRIAKSCG